VGIFSLRDKYSRHHHASFRIAIDKSDESIVKEIGPAVGLALGCKAQSGKDSVCLLTLLLNYRDVFLVT
jgi:hypothetical protein